VSRAIPCRVADVGAGWVITVGAYPEVRYFDVAIVDRETAIKAVRQTQQLSSDVPVQVTAALDEAFLRKFALKPGEIRRR
jgi:hypothetical protein